MGKLISRKKNELVKDSQVVETSSVVSFTGLLPVEFPNFSLLAIDLAGSLPNHSIAPESFPYSQNYASLEAHVLFTHSTSMY